MEKVYPIGLGLVAEATPITLGDDLPLVFNNATIDAGAGAGVTIDGAGLHRIFSFPACRRRWRFLLTF